MPGRARKPRDRGHAAVDEVDGRGRRSRRKSCKRPPFGRRVVLVPVDAVAVRHHDEQALFVEEHELLAEEARVGLRLTPEHVRRAEVWRRADDGDLDRVPVGARSLNDVVQPPRDLLRDSRAERGEDPLGVEDVARRIAVCAGGTGRHERDAAREDGERGARQAGP